MTINPTLFKAILSMDSYNRGYDRAIALDAIPNTTQIGTATITKQSDIDSGTSGVNIGFYALAYAMDTNGDGILGVLDESIISYRGTDRMGQDSSNGWFTAGGFDTPQSIMAIDFYNAVVDQKYGSSIQANDSSINIALTGHSLGGGLSGFVGALYDPDYSPSSSRFNIRISGIPVIKFKSQQKLDNIGNNAYI